MAIAALFSILSSHPRASFEAAPAAASRNVILPRRLTS
jgi:hypothetical protein